MEARQYQKLTLFPRLAFSGARFEGSLRLSGRCL